MGLGEKKEKVEEKSATDRKYDELKDRLRDRGMAIIEKRLNRLERKCFVFFPYLRVKWLLSKLRYLSDWW